MGALKKGELERTVPLEPSHVSHVAALKRLFELWALDQEFHDAYLSDPEAALANSGLDVDARAASLVQKYAPMSAIPVWSRTVFAISLRPTRLTASKATAPPGKRSAMAQSSARICSVVK